MAEESIALSDPRLAARARRPLSVGAGIPLAWLAVTVVASLLVPVVGESPSATSLVGLQGPSLAHPLGTDELGRDVLARVAVAGRTSLTISVFAVGLGTLIGIVLGAIAALRGRLVSEVIMRVMDVLLAFPAIILALVLGLMLGKGRTAVILVIAIVLVPQVVRLVRARLVSELQREYVLAEVAAGATVWRVLGYHVARNVAGALVAYAVLALADAMIFEAALSFIGLGVQPPEPSWGNMLVQGQSLLASGAWWVALFPGLALCLTILAINSLVEQRVDRWV